MDELRVGVPVHERTGEPADVATAVAVLGALGDDPAVDAERLPSVLLPVWTRPATDDGGVPLALHFDLKARFELPDAVMTGCATLHLAPVAAGDVLTSTQRLRSVGPARRSRLGTGRDWAIDVEHRNQRSELVGVESWTAFAYRAVGSDGGENRGEPVVPAGSDAPAARRQPLPAGSGEAPVGEGLPPLRHQLTAAEVVALATAARERRPVHLDADAARAAGLPDVILGTTGQQAWLHRAVTAWAGPAARLDRLDLRMQAPVAPGPLAIEGEVVTVAVDGHGVGWTELRLELRTGDVVATTATASVVLPAAGDSHRWRQLGDSRLRAPRPPA